MSRAIRVTVALAALVMSAAYALPLWRISLIAPQYPEGLGMLIRVNTIDGIKESDLQSINGLNHYIGMKEIVPDAIPELRYMPYILGALIVMGLIVAGVGRRSLLVAWSAALVTVFAAGIADFWKWGYDYGHDLSPTAIIKVPGMSYQPPVIGAKKLLNFTATSWPAAGGWILAGAAVAAGAALALSFRRKPRAVVAAVTLATAAACGPASPRAFALGEDHCDYCRMTISDSRYGGEAVTSKGRVLTFDSIECLLAYARKTPVESAGRLYVIDFQHPGAFVPVADAGFLTDVLIKTPMGRSVVAFASRDAAEQQRAMLGGHVQDWNSIVADSAQAVPR